jgi:hypothetical protein
LPHLQKELYYGSMFLTPTFPLTVTTHGLIELQINVRKITNELSSYQSPETSIAANLHHD